MGIVRKKKPARSRKPKQKKSTLTIRLTPADTAALAELKKATGQATGAGAIRYMIDTWPRAMKQRDQDIQTINRLEADLSQYRAAGRAFQSALAGLQALDIWADQ